MVSARKPAIKAGIVRSAITHAITTAHLRSVERGTREPAWLPDMAELVHINQRVTALVATTPVNTNS